MFKYENPLLLLPVAAFLIFQTACASWSREAEEDRIREEARRSPITLGFRDVRLGMDMNSVKQAWGTPSEIETAGSQNSGYERWIYFENPLGRQSASQKRMIYFEKGQVSGWETAQN